MNADSEMLPSFHGPTEWDPEPHSRWHQGCPLIPPGEVYSINGVDVCACGAQGHDPVSDEGNPDSQHIEASEGYNPEDRRE